MNNHITSGLIKKHRDILGEIEYHKKEIKRRLEDIKHIEETIKLFDPEIKLTHKGKARREYSKYFKPGELSRLILDVLREADKPLKVKDISDNIKLKKDIDDNIISCVKSCVRTQSRKRVIKEVGVDENTHEKYWKVL